MKNLIKLLHLRLMAIALFIAACPAAHAADISAPVVLVATDRLAGSPYQETVLLAVPSGDGEHLGLIVNRPTALDLAAIFPDSVSSQKVVDPVFFGGPVMSSALFAAIRTIEAPSNYSVALMPGLFLVTDQETIDALIRDTPNAARYFTGFVVWGAAELTSEISSGMWDVQPADANVLFGPNPQQLWIDLARNKRRVATISDTK